MFTRRKDGKENMYSYKIVAQVTRKKKKMAGLLKASMIILTVMFVLAGIMVVRGFMLPGFLCAGLYIVYDVLSQREYEYVLDGNKFTVSVILGKRYRREAQELDLRELEVVAPNWHESVAKYRKRGGTEHLKKYDYTSYEDDIPYYTMIIKDGGKKIKLLLDLTDDMLQMMKTMFPQKVFFA